MAPPADKFVADVMRALGVEGPSALARVLELPGPNSSQRVTRWLKGENEPDYQATMLMLEAAGWLRLDAKAKAAPPAAGQDAPARQLQELRDEVRRGFTRLDGRLQRIEQDRRESSARRTRPST